MGGYRTKVTAATPQLLPTGQIGAFVAAALERGDSVQYVPAQIVLPFTDTVTVTTASLPVGIEGLAYATTLNAIGGTLPYTWGATELPSWATLSGNTISGTPNSTAPSTIAVTATDANGRASLPVVLSLTVSGVGIGAFAYAGGSDQRAYVVPGPGIIAAVPTPPTNPGPQAIWRGQIGSTYAMVAAWPPLTGAPPTSYNFYLYQGSTKVQSITNVVPRPPTSGAANQQWAVFTSLANTTTYTAYATWGTPGVNESAPSPPLSITTYAGATATTPPTAPTPWTPASYSQPNPANCTTWKATSTSNGSISGTGSPGPGNTVTGCSLPYALNNASFGDIIVLTAPADGGTPYNAGGDGFPIPKWQGSQANGFVYIQSSRIASLPAEPPPPTGLLPVTNFSLTAAVSAGATSATLSANWPNKTALNPTIFVHADGSIETHDVLYTNGGTGISWTAAAGAPIGGYPIQTAADATIWVAVLPGVTPTDFANMAAIMVGTLGGSGHTLSPAANASYCRLCGINFVTPTANTTGFLYDFLNFAPSSYGSVQTTLAEYFTLDRCAFGSDSTSPATHSWMVHAIEPANCNQLFINGCYCFGLLGAPGHDSYLIDSFGGAQVKITNSFIEAASEGFCTGGAWVAQQYIPTDWEVYGNWCQKNGYWTQNWPITFSPATGFSFTGSITGSVLTAGTPPAGFTFQVGDTIEGVGISAPAPTVLSFGSGTGGAGTYNLSRSLTVGSETMNVCRTSGTLSTAWAQPTGWYYMSFSGVAAGAGVATGFLTNGSTAANWAAVGYPTDCTGATAWPAAAAEVKNHFELKIGQRFAIHDNWMLGGWDDGTSGQRGRAIVFGARGVGNVPAPGNNPWACITDGDAYNNVGINIGSLMYVFGGIDEDITAYTERVRGRNNQGWINPIVQIETSDGVGFYTYGKPEDTIFDHNTIIVNPSSVANPSFTAGIYTLWTAGLAAIWPDQLVDRITVTNNVFDGVRALQAFTYAGANYLNDGAAALAQAFVPNNSFWSNNLILNAAAPAGGWPAGSNTYQGGIAYTSAGFADWISNLANPLPPSNLNTTSGTYATASTTGAPLGATFAVPGTYTLANDAFPRTFVNFIGGNVALGVSGNTNAGVPFSTVVAQSSIVDLGIYLGAESANGGHTYQSLITGWKASAATNGLTLRAIAYAGGGMAPYFGSNGTWLWMNQALAVANMFAYTSAAGSGTTDLAQFSGYSQQAVLMLTPASAQTVPAGTINGKVNVNEGMNVWSMVAQYFYDVQMQGLASSKYGEAENNVACPAMDGWEIDNVTPGAYQISSNATWNGFGTTPVGNTSATIAAIQQGQAKLVAAYLALKPGALVMGNTAWAADLPVLDPSNAGLWPIVFSEEVIGESYSIETFVFNGSGSAAGIMARLITSMETIAPGGTLIFHMDGLPGGSNGLTGAQSSFTATQWQALRYGFACAMQLGEASSTTGNGVGCHFSWNGGQQSYNAVGLLDEQAQTVNGSANYGWLSYVPAGALRTVPDPPQSVANGPFALTGTGNVTKVWFRRFPNGWALWNPRGNGTVVITNIPTTLKYIASRGYGDTTVNTGLAVGSSVTMTDADGLFLIGTG